MRIHLLCDQKWRDLPNLTAIKILLERHGHRVLLSTIKDSEPMIRAFRPDCVVFNQLFSTANQSLARNLKAAGVAIVLLPTEGAVHPAVKPLGDGEFADYSMLDLYLAWGDEPARTVRARWGFDESVAPVAGFSRLDFYDRRYAAAITARESFCREHGLDPGRPIVTWATQYPYAHIHPSSFERGKLSREQADFGIQASYERIGLDAASMPEIHARAQKLASASFLTLVSALPDVQFIIRPHPAERREFYRALIIDHGLRNVRFCPQDYIWNVLNASDVHLHRHCTTAVEAWMWDKPTIEMAIGVVPQLAWPEREAGSDVVSNAEQLIAVVRRYLDGATISTDRKALRRNYVHRWLGPADGRHCIVAAEAIGRMLRQKGRARRMFDPLPGVRGTLRETVGAAMRYALGCRPNDPLLRPRASVPDDKQITRFDVAAYERLVAQAIV